jgi:hypothetical protein
MKTIKVFLIFLLIASQGHAQCAMCKAVVESGDNAMASGINGGILYLMAMPYLILVVVAFVFLRQYLKKKI